MKVAVDLFYNMKRLLQLHNIYENCFKKCKFYKYIIITFNSNINNFVTRQR